MNMSVTTILLLMIITPFFLGEVALADDISNEGSKLSPDFYRELDRESLKKDNGLQDRENSPEISGGGEKIPSGAPYFSYFLSLVVILGIVVLAAYLMRLFPKGGVKRLKGDGDLLKIIAEVPIGHSKSICLVEVLDRILVVGVGDGSVNLLAEIEDKEKIDLIKMRDSFGKSGYNIPFSRYLRNIFGRSDEEDRSGEGRIAIDFIEEQRRKLKNLNIS